MSGSLHTWYSLHDLEVLGARQAVLSGEIELRQLTRFAQLLHSDSGSVRASLRFRQRGSSWPGLTLQYETSVELQCQRCLEPFREQVVGTLEVVLLESDAERPQVPEGCEPVVLDDGRLKPARLIEDELIVSIPLVPKHVRVEDCGSLARLIV